MSILAILIADAVLRVGARGPAVIAAQNALRSAGAELVVDGDFGTITEKAVKRFQAAHGLTVDGEIGPKTAAALDAIASTIAPISRPEPSVLVVAPWLATMRALTGTREIPGAASNPLILQWRDEIIRLFPDLKPNVVWYVNDGIAWCGLGTGFCVADAGYKPPPAPLYATNWFYAWPDGVRLDEPALGAIMVMKRDGGGHVTLYEGEDDHYWYGRGGNQSDSINVARFPKDRPILGAMWPKGAALPTTGRVRRTFAQARAGSEA